MVLETSCESGTVLEVSVSEQTGVTYDMGEDTNLYFVSNELSVFRGEILAFRTSSAFCWSFASLSALTTGIFCFGVDKDKAGREKLSFGMVLKTRLGS